MLFGHSLVAPELLPPCGTKLVDGINGWVGGAGEVCVMPGGRGEGGPKFPGTGTEGGPMGDGGIAGGPTVGGRAGGRIEGGRGIGSTNGISGGKPIGGLGGWGLRLSWNNDCLPWPCDYKNILRSFFIRYLIYFIFIRCNGTQA